MKRLIAMTGWLACCAVTGGAHAAAPHYLTYQFHLNPGATTTIPIPHTEVPIRLMVSLTPERGTLTPTELVTAVVNEDPASLEVTWLGTNGDGIYGGPVAVFSAGAAAINALHGTSADPLGKLVFTHSRTATLPALFFVTMEF